MLLACGTWTVYVGDRLLDAWRGFRSHDEGGLQERHYFHWRHRRVLIPIAVCSASIATALVLRLMPAPAREQDSVLAAAALTYFSGVHSAQFSAWIRRTRWMRRLASKELLVGVLFTAGCATPALSRLHRSAAGARSEWPVLACIVFFAALAWTNCSAIESWESATQAGVHPRAGLLGIIGLAGSAALAFANPHAMRAAALLCAGGAGALLLAVLDRKRQRIAPLALRVLADAVLLTPAVLISLGARSG